jgi:hypothetical protein
VDPDKRRPLRGDHSLRFHRLEEVLPEAKTPESFYLRFQFAIDDLFEVDSEPIKNFARKVNAVKCGFNPLAVRTPKSGIILRG